MKNKIEYVNFKPAINDIVIKSFWTNKIEKFRHDSMMCNYKRPPNPVS